MLTRAVFIDTPDTKFPSISYRHETVHKPHDMGGLAVGEHSDSSHITYELIAVISAVAGSVTFKGRVLLRSCIGKYEFNSGDVLKKVNSRLT